MKTAKLSSFTSLTFSSLFLTFLTFFAASVATAQVPSYVPTNGLVGYWPFNGNANDESGNGNDMVVNGNGYFSLDRVGAIAKAIAIDGNNTYLSCSNSFFVAGNDHSISVWINFSSLTSSGATVSDRGIFNTFPYPNHAIEAWTYNSSQTGSGANSAGYLGNGTLWQSTPTFSYSMQLPLSTWHLWTMTKSGFQYSVYLDGILLNTFNNSIGAATIPAGVMFGAMCGGPSWPDWEINGTLDDIGIWNRALTADEVLALYNGCNVTPQVIAGNTTPSAFANSTYTCNNTAGSTYSWSVSNGVIVSGQGTNSITVLWGAEGLGSVTVAETTTDGCVGEAVVFDVNVQCVVSGTSITGPVGPEAFSNSTYTCNGAVNSTYQWTITNGVIVSGQGTNTVNVLWASTGIGNVSVVETTAEGCVGTTLSQDVVVVPVNVEELSNAFIVYPNPVTTELNLQTTSELIGKDLVIFDALGKQILKQQILSTNTTVNTSSFAAGNYVVKIGEGVKRYEVRR